MIAPDRSGAVPSHGIPAHLASVLNCWPVSPAIKRAKLWPFYPILYLPSSSFKCWATFMALLSTALASPSASSIAHSCL